MKDRENEIYAMSFCWVNPLAILTVSTALGRCHQNVFPNILAAMDICTYVTDMCMGFHRARTHNCFDNRVIVFPHCLCSKCGFYLLIGRISSSRTVHGSSYSCSLLAIHIDCAGTRLFTLLQPHHSAPTKTSMSICFSPDHFQKQIPSYIWTMITHPPFTV